MKTALRSLLTAALVGGLALSLSAAPKADKAAGKKKDEKAAAAPAGMYKLPETISLTDDQKAKFAAIQKEYTPKFRALAKKTSEILSPEQRKARRDAMKTAREAGKKPKEVQAAVEAASKLTDAQKEQLDKVKAETMKLRGEMEAKVVALLTTDQKAQLPKKGKKNNKRKKQAA